MDKRCRILILATGEFSGVTSALGAALRGLGCEVIERRQSLRALSMRPWYLTRIFLHALLVYRREFRRYLWRTYSAYVARSRAGHAIARKAAPIDAVIQLQTGSLNFWRRKLPGVRYAVYTDHTNLLSKQIACAGYRIPEQRVYGRWNQLEAHSLEQQDRVFVMGAYVKPAMVRDYQIAPDRITVVGAGPGIAVDIERDRSGKDYGGHNLLFVGKDPARKGLDVAVRAFARVRARYPDAHLHVVGTPVRSGDGVVGHGRVSERELMELFYDAQIFVFPAFREPLGLVLLEAMWSKAVCVATTVGAMPEIVREGETGFLVPPGDDGAIADRICELFADRPRLRSMAEAGYHAARAYWSWDKVADRILAQLSAGGLEG